MLKESDGMGDTNKGNKLIVILLIITMLIVVGLACFFGYMMLVKKPSGSNTQTTKKETIKTIELKEFVANLADGEGSFVKVTVSLGYTNKKLESEITDSMSIIRDAINKKLMEKKASDFKESGGLEKVQDELKTSVNAVLNKGQITNVYFSDIVIQ